MELLFAQFIKERRYLHNLSETTLTYYQQVFTNLHNSGFTELTKESLTAVIIKLRERGVTVGVVNAYIRGIQCVREVAFGERPLRELLPQASKGRKQNHAPADRSRTEGHHQLQAGVHDGTATQSYPAYFNGHRPTD